MIVRIQAIVKELHDEKIDIIQWDADPVVYISKAISPARVTGVYLTDAARWQDAASAHGKIFGDIRPACTFVEVSRLIDPAWLVEIEAECVVINDDATKS